MRHTISFSALALLAVVCALPQASLAQTASAPQNVALASSAVTSPTPAPLPGTDEILQKYRTALGGEAATARFTTQVLKGIYQTEDLSSFAGVEIISKAPNLSFTKITFPNGVTVHEVCNGKAAWLEDTVGGIHDFNGAALESRIHSSSFGNRADLLARMAPGHVLGIEQVGTHSTWVVAFTPNKKVSSKVYFDRGTGFAVRVDDTLHLEDGDYTVQTFLDDYRPVDGAYFPFRMRHVERGNVFTIRVTQIRNNVAVDNSVFVKPGTPSVSE
ncbi:MAG TPA: hypothetical protein VMH00_14290 [Candidatus Limnocylindrales bacterium]|nr:hypothetical protein [Candidatus Limnocylindrales bacterium]